MIQAHKIPLTFELQRHHLSAAVTLPLSLPPPLPPSAEQNMVQEGANLKDEMVVSIATGLVSVTSRASMTVIVIGGVVSTGFYFINSVMTT